MTQGMTSELVEGALARLRELGLVTELKVLQRELGRRRASAAHLLQSHDHGSPPEVIALARVTMGRIDVDPASSAKWNERIGAARIITAEQNFARTPWFAGAPAPLQLRTNQLRPIAGSKHEPETVFCNPPNDKRGDLVASAWWALAEYFKLGWARSAVYVGFNVEQLSRLQRVSAASHPLEHVTLVPAKRIDYLDGATLRLQEDAPHASFVTLLSRNPREIETFACLGGKLGHVVNGDRR